MRPFDSPSARGTVGPNVGQCGLSPALLSASISYRCVTQEIIISRRGLEPSAVGPPQPEQSPTHNGLDRRMPVLQRSGQWIRSQGHPLPEVQSSGIRKLSRRSS